MQSVSKSKQGGAARQNKFKTILYCLIVFFGFYYYIFFMKTQLVGSSFVGYILKAAKEFNTGQSIKQLGGELEPGTVRL